MSGGSWLALLAVALLAAAATWVLTWLVRRWLLRHGVLDRPNQRSSHAQAVPRGGGIAVIGVLLMVWAGLARAPGVHGMGFLLLPALALGLLSWIDDLRGLSPAVRLAGQSLAVIAGLWALGDAPLCQGALPFWADRAVAALLWLWFINLFNFMDGIDGITGIETLVIGTGVALVAALAGGEPLAALRGASLAGVALGFLVWNWHPARIFLGDVGSVGLGYLIGWLLLDLAAHGQWAAAALLPLYHFADASWTLARRVRRGERVWQAHRSHFYQRAAQAPADHPRVAGLVGLLGVALIALAVAAMTAPWPALAAGGALTGLLLWWFGRGNPV